MTERTPHEIPLHLRRFVAEDFATYRRWYADALLNQHLGPSGLWTYTTRWDTIWGRCPDTKKPP